MAKRRVTVDKLANLPASLEDRYFELSEAVAGNRLAQDKVRREALTTSDYPAAFAAINNAIVDQKYTELELLWPNVARVEYVDGFSRERTTELRATTDTTNLPKSVGGYDTNFNSLPAVPELNPYPEIAIVESEVEMWTRKNGARIGFSWEAFKSDKWNQIAKLPDDLAWLARNTDEFNVFGLLYSGKGFNEQTFTPDTFLDGNPALTVQSLQEAMAKAKAWPTITAGQRARANTITKWALIVPTTLSLTAKAVLAVTDMKTTDANGNEYNTRVDFGGDIQVVEVPWVPVLSTDQADNYGSTGWALVPFGGVGSDNTTTIASVSMRGHESPELRIKVDQGSALGGGALSPYDGSFDNDDVQIRIRHINNGQVLDPTRMGFVASKGTDAP